MPESFWPETPPTSELLLQAQGGNSQAIEQLLTRHRDSLRRMVDLRLDQKIKRRVDVSDVVQDVLIEANRRLQAYMLDPVMPFHLWIRQIAKDRIIDAHRRHRVSGKRSVDREQPLARPATFDQSTIELVAQLQDHQLTPAAAATQREMAIHVQAAIERLDERNREIILMRHFEQLSNQEVAQCLGLSEPAASMRYLRALKRLRLLLDGNPNSAPS
ncbi:sigma-70 family RNA polymerase sigma factor [Aureliella helgolandensis]|uniref:RNA polymerase sigma factor CnrH n=1 Tax=Aureliella helgolandensis TaxID=2527968 RepID=A0A518GBV4_9BACT|nr:sigma-70 family RNA polymerase sigma factor [Aureliella helgolandensis]QDV26106.1 RNA polymerase sigma factor CnrH [Aureliella helgolandensis]